LERENVEDAHVGTGLVEQLDLLGEDLKQSNLLGDATVLGRGEASKTVNHGDDDVLDVDVLLELGAGVQEGLERAQVELIVEDLDDDLHKVLLGEVVLAADDLIKDVGEDKLKFFCCCCFQYNFFAKKKKKKESYLLIGAQVNTFELAQTLEVGADEDTELATLLLAAFALAGEALVLHADPELVHLDKVGQDKLDRVLDRAELTDLRSKISLVLLSHSRNNN